MYSLNESFTYEMEVEKSRFISRVFSVKSEKEFQNQMIKLREEFPRANHYCYAYVLSEKKERFSDDGEPHGSAGKPLLELLHKHHLNNVALVVIRYFGGHKLGAGRLLRTYVLVGQQVLARADLHLEINGHTYRVEFTYSDYEKVRRNFVVFKAQIIKINYTNKVEVVFFVPEDEIDGAMRLCAGLAMPSYCEPMTILQKDEDL